MWEHYSILKKQAKSLKTESVVALCALSVLVVLSVIFYRERMLFIDAPHNLFLIINDGHFHIEEHRYGSFISQLLPLIGSQLHAPIKWVMVFYSIGFTLFFLVIGLILVIRLKDYQLAVLFALYFTLFASATFYWPNNEVHQGTAWLFLALAANFFIANNKRNVVFALLFFIASFYLAIWTHPLVMLEAFYLWFFLWIRKIDWPFTKTQSFVYTLILLVLAFFKFNFGMHHGYDSCKIETVTQFRPDMIKAILNSSQLHFFLHNCITNYWLLVILFITGIIFLIRDRRYLLTALTLLAAAGYLLLVCITFRDEHTNTFYIESEYMPLSIICCAPFVYFVLPLFKRKTGWMLLSIVFCIRLGYIINSAPVFTNRIVLLEKINSKMQEKNITKAIINYIPHDADSTLIMNWGAPVESILLSELKGENPQRTFIFLNPEDAGTVSLSTRDTLIGCWERRPADKLNAHYFQLDTSTPYKVFAYSSLME